MASFSEVRADRVLSDTVVWSDVEGPDELFINEAARLSYRNYRKYVIEDSDETSALGFIRMDSFFTAVIDTYSTYASISNGFLTGHHLSVLLRQ